MPECRGCGVALALHELDLCAACWDATEREDYDEPTPWQASLSGSPQDDRCPHGFPNGGWDCCRHDPSLDDHMEDI